MCRRAWHLEDKVRILRTLRWGEIGFANLRHANMVCPEVCQSPIATCNLLLKISSLRSAAGCLIDSSFRCMSSATQIRMPPVLTPEAVQVWNCKWLRLDWRWSGNWLHPRDWDNQTRLQVCIPIDNHCQQSSQPFVMALRAQALAADTDMPWPLRFLQAHAAC